MNSAGDPLQMGMLMGMMAAGGPMGGMMGGGMPSMPPGMPPMGLGPPMMGMPPAEDRSRRRGRRRARSESSEASASRSRSRSPPRRRAPRRVEEVERFLEENGINEEATGKVRALSPDSQLKIIARPLTGHVQNPSKVIIARVRELQVQAESASAGDVWAAWNSAMMGASSEAISRFIEDNDLDEGASRQLRSLPPHQQAVALKWDLSKFRNPSAKFMAMANNLGTSPSPRMAFPGMTMAGPTAMPMMPMGMRPMLPGMLGMPTMPTAPGMFPIPSLSMGAHR